MQQGKGRIPVHGTHVGCPLGLIGVRVSLGLSSSGVSGSRVGAVGVALGLTLGEANSAVVQGMTNEHPSSAVRNKLARVDACGRIDTDAVVLFSVVVKFG